MISMDIWRDMNEGIDGVVMEYYDPVTSTWKVLGDSGNGIRWYHWDPTKWSIQIAYWIGLAQKLKTVKFSDILKARLYTETEKFYHSKFYEEQLVPVKEKIIQSQVRFEQLKAEFEQIKKDYQAAGKNRIHLIQTEMRIAQVEFQSNMKKFKILLQSADFHPTA